jgi:transposase/uncharacterized coiled-coil protein SlyX
LNGVQRGVDKDAVIAAQAEQIRQLQAQVRQMTKLLEGVQNQLSELVEKKRPADPHPADGPSKTTPPAARQAKDKRKGKPRRGRLPEHLERDVASIEVESCPSCGSDAVQSLGQPEVSEKLDYVRAHVRVRRTERAKVRCGDCNTMSTAPMPPTAVPGGNMTASFLAHLVYSKCALHLPLARIAKDLRNQGVSLASSTLSDAMGHAADLLVPVHDRIVADLLASDVLHLDGTGLNVLRPSKKGGQYRGQMAAYCNHEATAYQFAPSKHGHHFADFLRLGTEHAFTGNLVVDAASNMNLLFEDTGITECGCWFHARDKFKKAGSNAPTKAAEGITWIGALFAVEHDADAAGDTAAERLARRRRDSRPLLQSFRGWMLEVQPVFAPDEELHKAVRYCLNHWDALTRFLDDGRIPLTNNLAERELGVVGRGRKAYLFAGSDEGGKRLAILYTVVRTCERLGVDPFAYMADVLPKLSDLPVNKGKGHLATLTPKAWSAAPPE